MPNYLIQSAHQFLRGVAVLRVLQGRQASLHQIAQLTGLAVAPTLVAVHLAHLVDVVEQGALVLSGQRQHIVELAVQFVVGERRRFGADTAVAAGQCRTDGRAQLLHLVLHKSPHLLCVRVHASAQLLVLQRWFSGRAAATGAAVMLAEPRRGLSQQLVLNVGDQFLPVLGAQRLVAKQLIDELAQLGVLLLGLLQIGDGLIETLQRMSGRIGWQQRSVQLAGEDEDEQTPDEKKGDQYSHPGAERHEMAQHGHGGPVM